MRAGLGVFAVLSWLAGFATLFASATVIGQLAALLVLLIGTVFYSAHAIVATIEDEASALRRELKTLAAASPATTPSPPSSTSAQAHDNAREKTFLDRLLGRPANGPYRW